MRNPLIYRALRASTNGSPRSRWWKSIRPQFPCQSRNHRSRQFTPVCPFLSKELHFQPRRQNVRIVVQDGAYSGTYVARFVGAAIGFMHQVEKPWCRRHWVEPIVEPVRVCDRWLSMMDVRKSRGYHCSDDSGGVEEFSTLSQRSHSTTNDSGNPSASAGK